MMVIEIPPNPNCEAVEMRIFHDLEGPRQISQIRLEREPGTPAWCLVTGWTLEHAPCEAVARKVDDSGEGTTTLVSGGEAGLRLQPVDGATAWRLDDPRQWGEPFLLIGDPQDLA
ncbi:MAG: hypothetical protein A3I71_01075 [Omnitrophica WOR_2 bacterium RIFCSPLOWO2_02_FULL_63_16]|nr:MAG: hypothetical protein A3E56_03205 [Omnitrophica WOR_2 bacterium RIFCSPHIGHO2_12_FULL_64_13]OGX35762.1 MAG: hypothetical protein A3B73_03505 [Omnitrophica WOR_2 bacterium RIFCSPHIGHO2_02_FULL_63_39]OGX45746.1 MAG: hypothetical protein A3I71_01075 [Omnitrophica WOR_2 bacterium RIFCSPLOWO2_02_FULL_63_16]